MLQTVIRLQDGRKISSGILSCTWTQVVNTGTELTLGSVCAAMAEVTLRVGDTCPVGAGDSFVLYKKSPSGQLHRLGIFRAEAPQWESRNRVKITAYDPVAQLDRDLTQWLLGLDRWPYTLQELAQLVCAQCGVQLGEEDIPNGHFVVDRFPHGQVTGRQLLSWIGQVAGRFCVADEMGVLHFLWYTQAPLTAGPDLRWGLRVTEDQGNLTLEGDIAFEDLTLSGDIGVTDDDAGHVTVWGGDQLYYRQGSLRAQNYETAPITAVLIRADETDYGAIWPDGAGENAYVIEGNPFLAQAGDQRYLIARALYEQLKDFVHTPMTLSVPADLRLRAGQYFMVTDSRGRQLRCCVMSRILSSGTDRLTGTGSRDLHSTTAVNNRSMQDVTGRVLRLQTDVDGIRAQHQDVQGRVGALELTSQGVAAQVSQQTGTLEDLKTSLSQLSVRAGAIEATVTSVREEGAQRLQNEFGLTIDGSDVTIHRSGSEMTNRLNETGMYVIRGSGHNETTMLRADAQGVLATDVTVGNFLHIGKHARLEDYDDGTDNARTACFWRED